MLSSRIAMAWACLGVVACSDSGSSSPNNAKVDGGVEVDGSVEQDGGAEASDGGERDASDTACEDGVACGSVCCRTDETCTAGVCTPQQDPCTSSDDCEFDTFCAAGLCTPFGAAGSPDHDSTCQTSLTLSEVRPVTQCAWEGPPAGDPYPDHRHVMSTTMVVDFNADNDPETLAPSIVFASYPQGGQGYQQPGVLRVISGNDCTQQWSADAPEDAVTSAAPVALADLTGDGRPEIVALAFGGGLLAFEVDVPNDRLVRLWHSAVCANGVRTPDSVGGADRWSGPSVHDLDDDGTPEIIHGATVYDADGCMLSGTPEFPAYSQGIVPVVLDIDGDGRVELIGGNAVRTWSPETKTWLSHPAFRPTVTLAVGQVAVAELGNYPVAALAGADFPEIAVVSNGNVRVQTLAGTVVFGPFAIPGGGTGGAPTIADFDGDGRREIGVAGGGAYAVFDLDCVVDGDASKCGGATKTTGVLWSQVSQDRSSNVTGSSVFDFDADGRAEVAYADECFFRIYDGATGAVVASIGNSSLTTYENPVIADADGDFHSEIVICSNGLGGFASCPANDPLFPTTKSAANHGVTVLRHAEERWAASRPVWNQHAYFVTNVSNEGVVPRSSEVEPNWSDSALNNFRQNYQGALDARGIGDLTVSGEKTECDASGATLRVNVCNRGTLPVPAGVAVAFVDGDDELCRATTDSLLMVGKCIEASCTAELVPGSLVVRIAADPDATLNECYEGNNAGRALVEGCATAH